MKTTLKALMLSGVALGLIGSATADEAELEARIAALEALVQNLSAQLEAERTQTDQDIVRLEAAASSAPAAAPAAQQDGMMLGETNVRVGGYIDLDAHVTSLSDGAIGSSSIARDFHIPGATPIGGTGTTATDMTAQASRIFIAGDRDIDGNKVSGYFEMDFLGSLQGDERVSSSFSPRLRRAYIDVNGLRVGQEWSTFQNTSAIPESASFLTLSDGMVFMRQAQIRYTSGNWQFALENGDTTVTPVGGGRVEADSNTLPDAVIRYNHTGDFGNVSFSGLARQLRYEAAGIEEQTMGYALSVAGKLNVGGGDDVRFSLTGGEGLGRYIGLNAANAAAVNPLTGELEAIPSYGGLIAWRHPFGETARLNLGYSGLFIDNPSYVASTMTQSVQSVYGAVLWDIAPRVTMGAELLFGQRENEAGNSGDISRFTFSTKYAF